MTLGSQAAGRTLLGGIALAVLLASCSAQQPSAGIEERAIVETASPDVVTVRIEQSGEIYLDDELLSMEELEARFEAMAEAGRQPEIHMNPHRYADYQVVAQVIRVASRQGLNKLGVIGGT